MIFAMIFRLYMGMYIHGYITWKETFTNASNKALKDRKFKMKET